MANVYMILTNAFDPDVRVLKEARYYADKGDNVEILAWDRQCEYIEKEFETVNNIKIKRFFFKSQYGTGLKQVKSYIKFLRACKKYLKDKNIDLLHCHDLDGAVVGIFVQNKKKLVFDMHEYYNNKSNKIIKLVVKTLVKICQNKSNFIIYLNDLQKNDIAKKNIKKLIYLPNYPLQASYLPIEKTKSDKIRISYIGTIRDKISFLNLFKAVDNISNIEINIYGKGNTSKYVENLAKEFDKINYKGGYNGMIDSSKIYANTDILYCVYDKASVLKNDGFPVKFFESIVTKTPLMVNKESIIADVVIDNKIGTAIDVNKIDDIKEKIIIMQNKSNYTEMKSKIDKLYGLYSWEKVVGNLDIIR